MKIEGIQDLSILARTTAVQWSLTRVDKLSTRQVFVLSFEPTSKRVNANIFNYRGSPTYAVFTTPDPTTAIFG